MTTDFELRRGEIEMRLREVRARIAEACAASGREAGSVDLLVVSKTFPASDIEHLVALGCNRVGESRDQEAKAKHAELSPQHPGLRWHMIGQVQRKKARSVAVWADVVESVDRIPLAEALSAAAVTVGRELDVLIQVSLDQDVDREGRGGCPPALVNDLAEVILRLPGLRLGGVMAVAPHPGDPDDAFSRLAEVHRGLLGLTPEALVVSAGMSDDLEAAVRHGATQVRIGGAVLGMRPPIR